MKEGYVYVMSNKAMPGLVKVGFTTGSPDERASQLNGTHSPHPIVVEYSAHVPNARSVEREAHRHLRPHREAKEWFRCSREVAIAAIKRSAGAVAKQEFSRVEQEKEHAAELELLRQRMEAEQRAKAEQERKARLKREAEQRYATRLAPGLGPPFSRIWGWSCIASFLVLAGTKNATFPGVLFGGILLGLFMAFIVKGVLDDRAAKSPAYLAAVADLQRELNAIDRSSPPASYASPGKAVIPCPKCHERMKLPTGKTLDATCPHCRNVFRVNT